MQIKAGIQLRDVPAGMDAKNLANQIADILQTAMGLPVRVNVTDEDDPNQWNRLGMLKNLNKGVALPGDKTGFASDEDRINLYRR
jgi:hypothetical protein